MGDLEHPLGPGQVGQPLLTEVEERHVGREVVGRQVGRRLGADDLAAPGAAHQPGGPVECGTEVVPCPALGRSDVDGHPHPERLVPLPALAGQGDLPGHGGSHGGRRRGEGGAQPVAGMAEHLPAPGFTRLGQQLVVAGQIGAHCLPVAFPPLRARHDVGEQERHRVAEVPPWRRGGRARRREEQLGAVLEGGEGLVARFTDGVFSLEPPGAGPVDCVMSVDPVAFLLIGFGRLSLWEAIALGLFTAGGERPDLALGFFNLFDIP